MLQSEAGFRMRFQRRLLDRAMWRCPPPAPCHIGQEVRTLTMKHYQAGRRVPESMKLVTNACLTVALAAGLTGAALLGSGGAARAVPVTITYIDAAGAGFNDATAYTQTPYSALNPTTLGAARKRVFEACASNWGQRFAGTGPITIQASFAELGNADPSLITLGSAGPTTVYTLTGTPYLDTWYVAALVSHLFGQDPDTTPPIAPMISAKFNTRLDSGFYGAYRFYYGTDGKVPGVASGFNYLDFYHVCFHEFGHGLGIISFLETTTSAQGVTTPTGDYMALDGVHRWPSVYDQLLSNGPSAAATTIFSMTTAQRKAAATGGAMYMGGANTRAHNGGANGRIYAPSPYSPGSSISHTNEATYSGTSSSSSINELMTPMIGPGVAQYPGPIITGVFQDMGYNFQLYTIDNAIVALRIAAGLQATSDNNQALLNVVQYTSFPVKVELADALKIARMAAGTEPNPNP
jgi:hypothetical protein